MRVSSCTLFSPLAFLASLGIHCHSFNPPQASVSFPGAPPPARSECYRPRAPKQLWGGTGSLMQWLKAVLSDRSCQREGKAPPPSCRFWKRALPGGCLGRWWLLFPPPFFFPLPALSQFPFLLLSSLGFALPPFPLLSFLPLPPSSPPSIPPPPLGSASLRLKRWKVTQGSIKRKDILMYFKIKPPYNFL